MFKLFKKIKPQIETFEIKTTKEKLLQPIELQRMDKLIDGELPFGWYSQDKEFIDEFNRKSKRLVDYAIASRNTNEQEKIEILKDMIQYYFDFKDSVDMMNECRKKHFDDNFLHCHNSRCNDFEYIQPYIDELEKLTK